MYHPTTRLLTILELLQARGMMNGADLAARLEVDRRTVRKYIMMLQDLGIPIETTRGPAGGYELRPGYKLPPLMFNNGEALAIMLSLLAARRQGIGVEPHLVESALTKIERVLPDELRQRLQAVQAVVNFVAQPNAPQPPGEMLLQISLAVHQNQQVHLRYRSQQEETERSVNPYGIVSHWDHWYMVGWCHLRQATRVFRLDRVMTMSVGTETFTPPPDFDSLHYVLESLATAPQGWLVEIWLEIELAEAQYNIPQGTAVLEDQDGGVLMRLYSADLRITARYLCWLDCRFDIRQPLELRAAVAELADQLREQAALHNSM